jgi:hypothetical protein
VPILLEHRSHEGRVALDFCLPQPIEELAIGSVAATIVSAAGSIKILGYLLAALR